MLPHIVNNKDCIRQAEQRHESVDLTYPEVKQTLIKKPEKACFSAADCYRQKVSGITLAKSVNKYSNAEAKRVKRSKLVQPNLS